MKKLMLLLIYLVLATAVLVNADVGVDTSIEGTGDMVVIQAIQTDSGDIDADTVIIGNGDVQAVMAISSETTGGNTSPTYNAIVNNGDLVFNTELNDGSNGWINMNVAVNREYLTINQLEGDGDGIDLHYIMNQFIEGADFIIRGETRSGSSAGDEILNIYTAISKVFVTRTEMEQYYTNQLNLHYRLSAIEKTLEKVYPDEFCESKLEVMRDNGLPNARCDDVTYYPERGSPLTEADDWIIGVKAVAPEPVPEPEQPAMNITFENHQAEVEHTAKCAQVEIWQMMCDTGMQKWCVIAETNRQSWGC
jgi:hypothetical protein